MSRRQRFEWTDERILEALHLSDVERRTFAEIADHFGTTRSSAAGTIYRIRNIMKCFPLDEHDGSMPPRWWAERRRPSQIQPAAE